MGQQRSLNKESRWRLNDVHLIMKAHHFALKLCGILSVSVRKQLLKGDDFFFFTGPEVGSLTL